MDEHYSSSPYGLNTLSPWFIVITYAATIFTVFLGAHLHFSVYTPDDISYAVQPISSAILQEAGSTPALVQIGLVIEKFHEFKVLEGKFSFNGTLWFRFDPSKISLETVEGVTLENGRFEERSKPYARLMGDLLFVRYAVRISFQSSMNFRDFPDDDHRLYLIFIHQAVSPGSLIFDSARPDFIILDDKQEEGWAEFDRSVQVGYFETQLRASMVDISMKHPTAVFGIDYRRSSMRDWLSMILPLLVMLGVTFCGFAMDREKFWKTRIEISLQSILGAVAFRFVMETMSPKVGYLMISDKIFFLFLTVFTFLFLVSLISPRLNTHYEKAILIFAQSVIAISCYIFWHGV